MLLDRKRINRWAKWVSLGLAVVFAVSFVFMGVGSGINVDWSSLWSGGGSSVVTPDGPKGRISAYEQTLAATPDDIAALTGIATEYEALGQDLVAASYLERAVAASPDDFELLMRLGAIYMRPDSRDYAAASRVFDKATALDPNNAQAFLRLGAAARGTGNIGAAILAWSRYLQLDPEGEMAETVRAELSVLSPTTTLGGTETTATTAGDTGTTTTTTQP